MCCIGPSSVGDAADENGFLLAASAIQRHRESGDRLLACDGLLESTVHVTISGGWVILN
jgi:hypothetical protein